MYNPRPSCQGGSCWDLRKQNSTTYHAAWKHGSCCMLAAPTVASELVETPAMAAWEASPALRGSTHQQILTSRNPLSTLGIQTHKIADEQGKSRLCPCHAILAGRPAALREPSQSLRSDGTSYVFRMGYHHRAPAATQQTSWQARCRKSVSGSPVMNLGFNAHAMPSWGPWD